jgi:dopamine beta-monooxygenase
MLSEMQFENNQDGGDVQILFDKTALRKKPFDKRKFLWLFGAVGIVLLVCGNIWAGWGSWGKNSKHSWFPAPTPAINSNNFNSSLNVKIKDFIFDFHWHIDFDGEAIQFSVVVKNGTFTDNRWLLIGFSHSDDTLKSDYCVFKNKNITDGYVDINRKLITDIQQDCELLSNDQYGFSFKRKWSTCDPRDIVFDKSTVHIYFASDGTETSNINEISSYNAKLFTKNFQQTPLESDVSILSIIASNLTVTTDKKLWCSITKLSDDLRGKKHHLVRIEPLISPGNEKLIEKIELFFCNYSGTDSIEYNGTCGNEKTKNCEKSVFVWSLGASPFDFPIEAGFPIGGSDAAGFIMLKIEYVNQNPINDSSGFNLYYTPTLRSNDAAILELGISPTTANAIPPQQKAFALSGFCVPECSSKFPENGITVFGSRLHTHSIGKLVRSSIYRNGQRIGNLNFDSDFSFNWSIVDNLEPQITVERNDMIMTTCIYDSQNRSNVSFGGEGPTDEMCANIIYYYPAMEVSVCKSAIDDNSLQNWFTKKGQADGSLTVKAKFDALPWSTDPTIIDDLKELYSTSPLKLECINQSGVLFEGMQTIKKPTISKATTSGETRIKYECPSIDD